MVICIPLFKDYEETRLEQTIFIVNVGVILGLAYMVELSPRY